MTITRTEFSSEELDDPVQTAMVFVNKIGRARVISISEWVDYEGEHMIVIWHEE